MVPAVGVFWNLALLTGFSPAAQWIITDIRIDSLIVVRILFHRSNLIIILLYFSIFTGFFRGPNHGCRSCSSTHKAIQLTRPVARWVGPSGRWSQPSRPTLWVSSTGPPPCPSRTGGPCHCYVTKVSQRDSRIGRSTCEYFWQLGTPPPPARWAGRIGADPRRT